MWQDPSLRHGAEAAMGLRELRKQDQGTASLTAAVATELAPSIHSHLLHLDIRTSGTFA